MVVEEVTAFRAEDGKLYATREEASAVGVVRRIKEEYEKGYDPTRSGYEFIPITEWVYVHMFINWMIRNRGFVMRLLLAL